MAKSNMDVVFSDSVKAQQKERGSRTAYQRVEDRGGWAGEITPDLAAMLAGVRSFYFGTASASGQPYIQHRGGPAGFLVPLDEHTLGFADYEGNRQYISLGNLAENPKATIFIMDYAHRSRVKFWGEARVVEDDPDILQKVSVVAAASPVRAIVFKITAWDSNCPQHIPILVPLSDVEAAITKLQARISELEAQLGVD